MPKGRTFPFRDNPYDQSFRHQRFISTAHLSSFYLPLGRWEVLIKRIVWDIDSLLSHRLFLFPLLSGRAKELITWDYRYRCLSCLLTLFGPYSSLFFSPSVSQIRTIDHMSWLPYGYLRNMCIRLFNILFPCISQLFLHSTALIQTINAEVNWDIDIWVLSLRISLFQVGSTNSKNDWDIHVRASLHGISTPLQGFFTTFHHPSCVPPFKDSLLLLISLSPFSLADQIQ